MVHSRYRMIAEEERTSCCCLGNFTYTVLLRGVSSPSLQRTEEDEGELFWQTLSKIITLAWPYASVYCRKSPPSPDVETRVTVAILFLKLLFLSTRFSGERAIDRRSICCSNELQASLHISKFAYSWSSRKQYIITIFLSVFRDAYSRASVQTTNVMSRSALVRTSLLYHQHLASYSIYL
jgi:hypothetical protein